ncbi:TonB C-terminal domain-containing protein [Massilia sp. IC2-476]|uniref:TonB C-terminal domain-containing protein n=1 Tax=Massilia sp. IC2-476 TaxID=2887199 RepID=UPI001D10724F|nr:TonB C-terminal domain-containing protein [Massilia sp. IC2-476]MCC2974314.1 TonB C-terminal domain-containing protein [Massilia sp. IC2-476]
MNISLRSKAQLLLLAALAGCASPLPVPVEERSTVAVKEVAAPTPAPAPPPSLTLDAYKEHVARHILDRNADRSFSGRLPPMLPAVVVVSITVDRDGQLTDVQVQRSRDPDASRVALASMLRSGPLPRPHGLLAANSKAITFSETFLFDRDYRFQLRTLAGPQ